MAVSPTTTRRPLAHWPVVLLVLLSIPIIFYRLGTYDLVNGDEGLYHAVARNMVNGGNWFRLEFGGEQRVYDTFMNAPIQYWARAILIRALGDNYWSMRLLSAIFGLLSILMTYLLVYGVANRWAAFVAALLQLTTLQFVYLHGARTGELETIVTFLLTLSAYLFLRAIESRRSFLSHHVCLIMLMNVKLPLVLLPLIAELLFFAVTRPSWQRLRSWVLVGLLILPIGLIWHVAQAVALGDQFWRTIQTMLGQASGETPDAVRQGGVVGSAVFYARTLLFGAFPYVIVYPFAIAGALRMLRSSPRALPYRVLVLYPLVVFSFYLIVAKHFPWYIVPAYPFLCALLALWLERLRRVPMGHRVIWAAALALALLAMIRVEVRSFNPFAHRAMDSGPELTWRTPLEASPAVSIPVLVILCAGLLYVSRTILRVRFSPALAYALTGVLVGVAAFRTIVPLKYTDHETPMGRLHRTLSASLPDTDGRRYPIPVLEPGVYKAIFYFGDDFRIQSVAGPPGTHFLLYPRGSAGPPRHRISNEGARDVGRPDGRERP